MGHRDPDVKYRVSKPIKANAPKNEEEKKSEKAIVKAEQVYNKRKLYFLIFLKKRVTAKIRFISQNIL